MQLRQTIRNQLQRREILLRDTYRMLTAVSPERRISDLAARSRLKREALNHAVRIRTEASRTALAMNLERLNNAMGRRTEGAGMALLRARSRLEAINPLEVLNRGYTLVYDPERRILPRKTEAIRHKTLIVRFADGEIEVHQDG